MKFWTIALGALIVVDAVVTTHIGLEANPVILWVMSTLNITLKQAMILKVVLAVPCLAILDLTDWSRFTCIVYVLLYVSMGSLQFI